MIEKGQIKKTAFILMLPSEVKTALELASKKKRHEPSKTNRTCDSPLSH